MASTRGPSTKFSARYPSAQDAVGCMVAHQFSGRQVGVALDEHEGDSPVGGDGAQHGGLAGAGWPLEEHVASGGHGGPQELELAGAPHHPGRDDVRGLGAVIDRHGRAI